MKLQVYTPPANHSYSASPKAWPSYSSDQSHWHPVAADSEDTTRPWSNPEQRCLRASYRLETSLTVLVRDTTLWRHSQWMVVLIGFIWRVRNHKAWLYYYRRVYSRVWGLCGKNRSYGGGWAPPRSDRLSFCVTLILLNLIFGEATAFLFGIVVNLKQIVLKEVKHKIEFIIDP